MRDRINPSGCMRSAWATARIQLKEGAGSGRPRCRISVERPSLVSSLELRDFRLDLQRLEQGPYAIGLVDIFRKVDQVSPKRSAGTKNLNKRTSKRSPVLARFDQALSRLK